MQRRLLDIYQALFDFFGPQRWWPGETPLEILVGAVLTQNTNWTNVSRAIDNLRARGLLSLGALVELPLPVLAETIRPSGYYNLKAVRLQNLLRRIAEGAGSVEAYFHGRETAALREELLAIKGIGPETADSILLYAAGKPTFVVDAYTHRILSRHNLAADESDYHELQALFLDHLPQDAALFNEYHALIVRTGKEFCRKGTPRCESCPLKGF
ncbi:MAG: endonuclease III domain-containing protein [Thermodesulfobacteriota bacterium]